MKDKLLRIPVITEKYPRQEITFHAPISFGIKAEMAIFFVRDMLQGGQVFTFADTASVVKKAFLLADQILDTAEERGEVMDVREDVEHLSDLNS